MKKIKLFGIVFALAIAIVFSSSINSYNELSDLYISNIEALADPGESGEKGDVGLQCSGSCVIICQKTCPSCLSNWQTMYATGNCVGVRGVCTCGHSF